MRADVSISTRLHFMGIPGRIFFKLDVEKIAKVRYW